MLFMFTVTEKCSLEGGGPDEIAKFDISAPGDIIKNFDKFLFAGYRFLLAKQAKRTDLTHMQSRVPTRSFYLTHLVINLGLS